MHNGSIRHVAMAAGHCKTAGNQPNDEAKQAGRRWEEERTNRTIRASDANLGFAMKLRISTRTGSPEVRPDDRTNGRDASVRGSQISEAYRGSPEARIAAPADTRNRAPPEGCDGETPEEGGRASFRDLLSPFFPILFPSSFFVSSEERDSLEREFFPSRFFGFLRTGGRWRSKWREMGSGALNTASRFFFF